MKIQVFTSHENPQAAIEHANKAIQEMKKKNYEVKQITQSESIYYNTFQESKRVPFYINCPF